MDELTKASIEAANIFLGRIFDHAYQGSINGVRRLLEKGPVGRAKQPEKLELYDWYQNLDLIFN